ncbi:unnamed protein product [Lymnaea stagnalis]|uniref:Uncharacterized protein n=1 Tax=Lymnaea stagnalis TaxID=6523 RepID=A0AAV2HAN2_LYMST
MPRGKQTGRTKKRGKKAAKTADENGDNIDADVTELADESQTSEQLDDSQLSERADDDKKLEHADESNNPVQVEKEMEKQDEKDDMPAQEKLTPVVKDDAPHTEEKMEVDLQKCDDSNKHSGLIHEESCSDEPIEKDSEHGHTEDEGHSQDGLEQHSHPEGGDIQPETSEEMQQKKETEMKKKEDSEEQVIPYKPHILPAVSCAEIVEKWEWHIRIFPIDHADIRTCVLDSVSKIAQETWFYVDKKNFGMGAYDLCMRSSNDAAMVILKTLQVPMTYRYVTIKVTRRGRNKESIEKIKAAKTSTDNDAETIANQVAVNELIEELHYSEIEETATLLLDFLHTPTFDKVKGKEKKRSLYVKYLPEGTSKELLNVLFPVANNLDIIKTGKGRRVGELNVTDASNVLGMCKAYVTIHINGAEKIYLDWKEENLDDGVELTDDLAEIPWEILPRNNEISYEAVPEMVDDEMILYRKRKREMEMEQRKNRPKLEAKRSRMEGNRSKVDGNRPKGDINRSRIEGNRAKIDIGRSKEGIRPLLEGAKGEKRERRSRWDKVVGPVGGADVLKMQLEMNEKIQSQLALLQSVTVGVIPSLMDTPLLPGRSREIGRKDRKRERPDRDRKISDRSSQSEDSRHSRERILDRRDRSGGRDRRDGGRPDPGGRGGRFDNPVRGGHFGGGRGGKFPGGGGRFDDRGMGSRFGESHVDRFGRGGRFDGRDIPRGGVPFDPLARSGQFDIQGGGHFEPPGGRYEPPGPVSHFEHPGRAGDRFDGQRRGGSRFDSKGRGGHFEPPGRVGSFENIGRGASRFEGQSRGGSNFDSRGRGAGRFDNQGRGGGGGATRFDNRGRGASGQDGRGRGGFDNRGRGKTFGNTGNNTYVQGGFGNNQQSYGGGQGYGNNQGGFGFSNNYGNQPSGYGNQTSYTSSQTSYPPQASYTQPATYNQQGSYVTPQNNVAVPQQTDYATQQTAQTGYSTQSAQQASYTSQPGDYVAQQASYDQSAWGQQAYPNQQQTTGYPATTGNANEGYWGQTDYTAAASNVAQTSQPDYSQAYAQQATAGNIATQVGGYTYNNQSINTATANTPNYSTDAAYTNQAFYGTGQGTTSVQDVGATYGAYSTQETPAYGTAQQANLTTAYNFAQYPSGTS